MKHLTVIALMFIYSISVFAGPNEDRAKAVIDNLYGKDVSMGAIRYIFRASFITYQGWLPQEDYVIGQEEYSVGTEEVSDGFRTEIIGREPCEADDPDTADVDESIRQCDISRKVEQFRIVDVMAQRDIIGQRTQDPTEWTNERSARFFLRVIRKDLKGKVKAVEDNKARMAAQAIYDNAVEAASAEGSTETSELFD
jgi:hypothetical protein